MRTLLKYLDEKESDNIPKLSRENKLITKKRQNFN